ncbi:MAG: zinc ribbon domain-containing protein [Firmicutes bacterium]|nr:zinc ribbon domain-containing protein [Bacillota bacterium]
MDQDIFNTKGINGHIYLYEQKLLIERKGFLAAGLKSKELSFNDFSSIEIKEATSLVNGFITFVIPGKNEHIKNAIKAGTDEYSITFRKKSNEDFLKFKSLIEEQKEKYISENQSSNEKRYCENCGSELNTEDKFCSECGNPLSNEKDIKTDIDKIISNEKNKAKKGGLLKKTLMVLLTLMLPPIGIFFVFKSKRFKNTGKIIASIWLGVFLLMRFVDTDDKNTSEVASQQTQQEVVEDNTEKPQSTLSKMVSGLSQSDKSEKPKETPGEMEIKEYIKYLVKETLGTKSNMGYKKYLGSSISKSESSITIKLYADENFTNNMTRGGINSDSKDIFVKFFNDRNDYDDLVLDWYLKLVDQRGNEKVSRVLLISFDRKNFNTVNWDNIITDNIPKIANSYWAHPAIR